ncbi:MAG: iron ABC transporter permease [Micrococcales bacterium]|nr:iron ABC transporter permease [Micrococcales bacterium]
MRSFRGRAAFLLAAGVPLAFLGVFFAYPVAALVGRGFVGDGGVDFSGFAEVFSRPRTWRVLRQTLGQATWATAVVAVLGVPAAHILYRRRFPGRGALRVLLAVPFVLPAVVVGVAFRSLLSSSGALGWTNLDGTMAGVVLALIFFNFGVLTRAVGLHWAQLDSRPEEAAAALGASPARVFGTVTLPRLAPAIASGGALVFLFSATAFGTVLILGGVRYGTIETEIWLQTTQMLDLRAAAVLSVVQFAIVALVLSGAGVARGKRNRAATLGAAGGGARAGSAIVRRGQGSAARLRANDLPALGVTLLIAAFLLAPLAELVGRSLRTPQGWGLGNYARLAERGGVSGLPDSLLGAAARSAEVAGKAAVLALVLGLLIAGVLARPLRSRAGRRTQGAVEAILMLPLGVSAVTVGFGFLIALNKPPLDLRTSPLLLPIAQAIVALPLVIRAVLPAWRGVSERAREAAAVLGARPSRVLASIDGPVLVRASAVGGALAFAVAAGEFGATAFLSRPETATLPVAIYRLLGRPGAANFGTALAACVLLAAMTSLVMALAERSRSPVGGAL